MANVPTWRSQAAPSFDAALRAAATANKQQTEGLLQVASSIDEGQDVVADIRKRQAMELLSPADDAIAREKIRNDPANAGLFGSSYVGEDVLNTMETDLAKLDPARRKVRDKTEVMNELAHLRTLKTDQDKKAYLNEMATFRQENNIKDDDKILQPFANELLARTQVTIDDSLIRKHGGNPLDERSLTPDVLERIEQDVLDQVQKNNKGASTSAIKNAYKGIVARSKYNSMFERVAKKETKASTVDKELEKQAGIVTDALHHGTNEQLITAINNASNYLQRHQHELKPDQAKFIERPLLRALEGMKVDAFSTWSDMITKAKGDPNDVRQGSLNNQHAFRKLMIEKYHEKFKWLPTSIIDKKVAKDIQDGQLGAIFQSGKRIAQFRTQDEVENFKEALQYKKEVRNQLRDMERAGNVWSVVADRLQTKINKTMPPTDDPDEQKLRDTNLGELYNHVRQTVRRIDRMFRNPETGEYNLDNKSQEHTLKRAIMQMFTSQGGIDKDGNNWNPFDDPFYTLMGMSENDDMTSLSDNQLLEALQEFLPGVSTRGAESQAKGATLLEDKIAAVRQNKEIEGSMLDSLKTGAKNFFSPSSNQSKPQVGFRSEMDIVRDAGRKVYNWLGSIRTPASDLTDE